MRKNTNKTPLPQPGVPGVRARHEIAVVRIVRLPAAAVCEIIRTKKRDAFGTGVLNTGGPYADGNHVKRTRGTRFLCCRFSSPIACRDRTVPHNPTIHNNMHVRYHVRCYCYHYVYYYYYYYYRRRHYRRCMRRVCARSRVHARQHVKRLARARTRSRTRNNHLLNKSRGQTCTDGGRRE